MTREYLMTRIAAIVTALHDCGTDAAESTFYLALGMNLSAWTAIRDLMVASDLIAVSRFHRVSLTAKGSELARDCNAIVAEAKQAALA